jgi:LexA-binding, inner membrane-associated putative hydrolase
MANFPTHIAVGTVVSGALATVTLAADVVAPENLVAVTLAGVLGSVLPDIDLKDSRPSRAMFAGLGVFFAFAVLFSLQQKYSVIEMIILWLGTLVLIRYVAQTFFHRLSAHRGIWHSILASLFCACATATVYTSVLGRPAGVAWLAAGFMIIGYLTHLILDELYSVDVMDTRLKASFGTALKLIDPRHPFATAAMVVATVIAFLLSPPLKSFVDGLTSRGMWSSLQHRLLPQDKWFGLDWRQLARLPELPLRQRPPVAAHAIETGSITPAGEAASPNPKRP